MPYENEADIRILTGEQGKGKSITAVGYAVDDYHAHAVIISPTGDKYPVFATFPQYVYKRGDGKYIQLPKNYRALGYRIESPVRIFANFHLYGVRYVYTDLPMMVKYMNSPLIKNAWFLVDENFMIDKRNSMTQIGKIIASFGATVRKRHLHLLIMVQYKSMAEMRFRAFATQTILCDYDDVSKFVTLTIRKKGEKRTMSVSYFSPQYRKYYDTDELIPIPEYMMEKAKQLVGAK